jgi:hypothetical protein
MRQLIGKIPIKSQGLVQEVYFSELVYCQDCQRTVPIGIEVVAVKRDGDTKKVVKHRYYCRAHGGEYQARING